MTSTKNAPKTFEDLKQLLYFDNKVKVAGKVAVNPSRYCTHLFRHRWYVWYNLRNSQLIKSSGWCPARKVYGAQLGKTAQHYAYAFLVQGEISQCRLIGWLRILQRHLVRNQTYGKCKLIITIVVAGTSMIQSTPGNFLYPTRPMATEISSHQSIFPLIAEFPGRIMFHSSWFRS